MQQNTQSRPKRSLFFSAFSTYVFVLVPLMVIISVASIIFMHRLQESNESASVAANTRLSQITDANLIQLRQLTLSLFSDAELADARSYEYKDYNPQELIVFNHVQKKLNTSAMAYDLLKDVYLYYSYSNTVIGNQGLYSNGSFAQYCEGLTGFSWQQLLEMQEYPGNYAYDLSMGTDGKGHITVLSRYLARKDSAQNILVWVLVDADALISAVRPMRYDPETQFALVDPFSGACVGADVLASQLLREEGLRPEDSHYRWKAYHVTAAASGIGPWYALSFDLFTRFDRALREIVYLLIALAVICALCLMLAWYFGKRQVRPIQRIYQALSAQNAGAAPDQLTGDVYKRIENEIIQMSSRLSDNREMLMEKQNHIKSMMLLRILRNRTLDQFGVEWVLQNYGITLAGPSYRVLSMGIDQLPDVAKEYEDQSGDVEFALMHLTGTAISTFLEPDFRLNVAMDNTRFVFVINGTAEAVRGDGLAERLRRAGEYLKTSHGLNAIFALGEARDSREELSQSYDEASTVLEYSRMTGRHSGLYSYAQVMSMPNAEISFGRTMELRVRFINQMSMENYAEARQTLTEILHAGDPTMDSGMGGWKMQLLLVESMLSYALMDSQTLSSPGFSEQYLSSIQMLHSAKSLRGAQAVLDGVFSEMEARRADTADSANTIIGDVMSYVQDNYCSSDLSIGGIADQFGVSISYISRQFKRTYGVGMLDYVHRLRINKAKQLLSETDELIKTISEQVGYINALTMSRSFKRYEGILPSEYRTLNEKN